MSVYAYMQNAEQQLVVVQDGKILAGQNQEQALETINQTLLALSTKLKKEMICDVEDKRLVYLKHPKLDRLGRVCYAFFICDKNQDLETIIPNAQALGFEVAEVAKKLKWWSWLYCKYWVHSKIECVKKINFLKSEKPKGR
ncbi:hypothetical protein [Helicobacter cynogastricus]|uniref:hypothetical protein n=1 Tax=Helicobacter cynogastricus TaxID=329937 RepID=UPI000CF0F755|nr:hypothetical protein [Helicobacter cynogastricus]